MAAAGFVCGLFAAPVFFLSETALQEAVPEDHRARVFAARDALARAAFLATAALGRADGARVRRRGDAGRRGGAPRWRLGVVIRLPSTRLAPRAEDARQRGAHGLGRPLRARRPRASRGPTRRAPARTAPRRARPRDRPRPPGSWAATLPSPTRRRRPAPDPPPTNTVAQPGQRTRAALARQRRGQQRRLAAAGTIHAPAAHPVAPRALIRSPSTTAPRRSAAAVARAAPRARGREQLRIVADQRPRRARARLDEHRGRRAQVGELEPRQPGLARAPQLARAAQPQVVLGEREAVVGRAPGARAARAPSARGARPGDEHAHRAARPPRPTRPRSWCSCVRPKRSACSTTITVAFGHVDADLDHRGGDQHRGSSPAANARHHGVASRRPSCGRAAARRGRRRAAAAARAARPRPRRPRSRRVLALLDQRARRRTPAARRASSRARNS